MWSGLGLVLARDGAGLVLELGLGGRLRLGAGLRLTLRATTSE